MDETILSAGIDVGTSTTQIIFSRMTIQNTGGFGSVPKIEIVDKEIIYESEIYFTPLLSENEIDGDKVSDIVMSEYKKANLTPDSYNHRRKLPKKQRPLGYRSPFRNSRKFCCSHRRPRP